MARNILLGKGLGWQALWFPPLYSIFIAAVSSIAGIRELVFAASLVSVVCGAGLAFAVYFLASRLFDWKTAFCAAILCATFPHLLQGVGEGRTMGCRTVRSG
ncbi:glycosyltransferase family 39 protein [Geotalea sp. SG265]|uniref:glycosyltransferase family 39 protein n=1 Tax=Geotalea sp. SG265 TaxID=2922867 RepID=UPI001FAEC6C5|nr:glycosyltransferase family 39 protein [Geotalea sp. SG265]